MDSYYTAGYYVLKVLLQDQAWLHGKSVVTCSSCINQLAFDYWCFGWGSKPSAKDIKELDLSEDQINSITKWTNDRYRKEEIAFDRVFPTLELASEYKSEFFPGRQDISIYCIDFPESDRIRLINDFAPGVKNGYDKSDGKIGLRQNLLKGKKTLEDDRIHFLGFDLIGVEVDGGFHSFHCHCIYNILESQFGLKMNDHGLFDDIPDPESLRHYLNEPDTPVEDVPWYIVKVSRLLNGV